MSTISDWTDDFGGADLNTPQGNTGIAFPANATTDLGFIIRDTKAVIRQESLNKGWQPDATVVTRLGNTSFSVSGDLRTTYPPGTAVRLDGDSTIYTFVQALSFANSNTTVTTASGTIPANTDLAIFSALLPASHPGSVAAGYTADVGSCFPYRISQWGRFETTTANLPVTVYFAKTEPNATYRLLLQVVGVANGPADNESYRPLGIEKSTGSFLLSTPDPGFGPTLYWEFAVVRGT